jgi:predicted Zn-dependent protease
MQMAPVLISEDRQSLMGRRILEGALSKEGRSRGEIVEALLGIATSYMMDGDLKQAEDTLQKAIGNEPYNLSALMNLAIIQLKKGNYPQAMRDFDAIVKKNPQSAIALYGKSMATMEYARRHNDLNPLPGLIRDVRAMVAKTAYLRQELTLFQIYAQSLMGDVDGVNQAVVQFLNQTSGEARNYVHPLSIDWRFTQWDYLEKYCAEIFQKYSTNPEVKALRSVCLMEINRDSDASKLLQEAMAEAPKDPYVLATQAGYLAKIGRVPEAKSVLKMPEVMNLNMRNLLMGRMCVEAQDVPCAQNAFAAVYSRDRQSAPAAYGLAWVKMRSKERSAAYDYVRMGLQSEQNYIPLLDLRDQLEFEQ